MTPTTSERSDLRVCVVHPDASVRSAVTAACPGSVTVHPAADLGVVRLLAPAMSDARLVVVALDPALTSPTDVTIALGHRPHVLSISDLRLDVPDPAVDSVLPRRRLTPRTLGRHLAALQAALDDPLDDPLDDALDAAPGTTT